MSIFDMLFGSVCIPKDRLVEIADAMDLNGDGMISLSEFAKYLKGYERMVKKTAKATGTEAPRRR